MLDLMIVIATGSALFLAFLLIAVRNDVNILANRWLSGFVLALGCLLLDSSFSAMDIYRQFPALIGCFDLALFAVGPLLYICVSHFVVAGNKFRLRDTWHFGLLGLFAALSFPFLFSGGEAKLAEMDTLRTGLNAEEQILLAVVLFHVVSYWALSLRKLQKHRRAIAHVMASPEEYSLGWLTAFLYGTGALILLWVLEMSIWGMTLHATLAAPGYLALIWVLGYYALRQKEMFPFSAQETREVEEVLAQAEEQAGARKPGFDDETLELLKTRLRRKMEEEKLFLDPDLNLPALARSLNLSVHEMSRLVNEGFGENVAQFVNRYRVEESSRLLLSEQHAHLSMVGIAYESGFNSKTAFNTAFKKVMGLSPTAFQAGEKERLRQLSTRSEL